MLRIVAAVAKAALLMSSVLAVGIADVRSVAAVSVSPVKLQLFADKSEAFVNTKRFSLDEPPAIINGQLYVPAKWVTDALDMQLLWDTKTQTAQLLTAKAYIQFELSRNQIEVNGKPIAFDTVAEIRNGRLLVQLSWLAAYTNITYHYDAAAQSVQLSELGEPASAYQASTLRKDDALQNSRPIAKFAMGKASYRLGEPVTYTDLSYDPDSEGLPGYDWSGKKDAYFKPGAYLVTLKVKDGKGNESEPFPQTVKVLDVPYMSEQEYPFYFKPPGSLLSKEAVASIARQSQADPILSVTIGQPLDRRLLRGSSSRPIREKGFLFQESVNGKARLYTQYINGMNEDAQLAIVIRNHSYSMPVHVNTTAAAESQASVYTPILGSKTVESFVTNSAASDKLVVNPGAVVLYKVSPTLSLGQGFQGIYDIEADGAIDVSYVMLAPGEQPYGLGAYRMNPSSDLQRSVLPVSDVSWQVDARTLKSPLALAIGDGSVEPVLRDVSPRMGTEPTQPTINSSNAGVRYRIRLELSAKAAMALYPRGGFFAGAVRVNGRLMATPAAGLTANEGLLLHRTAGFEQEVEIELMTAGSNQLPVDIIVYPLPDKQQ